MASCLQLSLSSCGWTNLGNILTAIWRVTFSSECMSTLISFTWPAVLDWSFCVEHNSMVHLHEYDTHRHTPCTHANVYVSVGCDCVQVAQVALFGAQAEHAHHPAALHARRRGSAGGRVVQYIRVSVGYIRGGGLRHAATGIVTAIA